MKKSFVSPRVSSFARFSSGSLIGEGSGQGTTNDEPWDWEMWSVLYEENDSDGDGTPGTWDDYVWWWYVHMELDPDNFTDDLFEALNNEALPSDPRP